MLIYLFPLLLLVMAIASLCWYQQTGNDMFWALAASSAIIALIWGLVIVHWSIQLIGLLLLLRLRMPLLNSIQVKVNDKLP